MPTGTKFDRGTRLAVIAGYYQGRTVNELCALFNVKRRTVYEWISKEGRGPRDRRAPCKRETISLSKGETELLLLLINECDSIIKGDARATMLMLEDRLLSLADELSEFKEA